MYNYPRPAPVPADNKLLVFILYSIYLGYFVCVSVCHNCGKLCYSFSFNNQTDQGDEM
jgi:hypothetical protein